MRLEDMLTKKEAARLGKISDHTISAWLTQKRLRRFKMGSRTFVSKLDLEKLLRVKDVA